MKVTGLAPGIYAINEVEAPRDFIKNTEPISFEIKNEATGKPESLIGKDFINYKGSIKMLKANTDDEGLGEAEFSLFNKDDNPETSAPLGIYISDSFCQVEISDISPGSYKLIETKAPVLGETNYIKNEYPRFFIYQKITEVNLSNTILVSIKISKVKRSIYIFWAQKLLKKIKTEEPIISDNDGKLNLANLGAGYYKLVEVKAPVGYLVNNNPIFITILEENKDNP